MNVHKNARLAPCGREVLVSRLERGEHPRDVGTAMGVSTSTVYKWRRRPLHGPAAPARPGPRGAVGTLTRRGSMRPGIEPEGAAPAGAMPMRR